MRVLALDPGSSTLKYALIDVKGRDASTVTSGARELDGGNPAACDDALRDVLAQFHDEPPGAIGHRIVFGGERQQPERVTEDTIANLQRASALDPLHAPLAIAAIRAA